MLRRLTACGTFPPPSQSPLHRRWPRQRQWSCFGSTAMVLTQCRRVGSANDREDDTLASNVHALLQSTGALPVSTVSSMLDDKTMEAIAAQHKGGLAAFCRSNQKLFRLHSLPGGVHILLSNEALSSVKETDLPAVECLIALVCAAQYLPRKMGPTLSHPPKTTELLAELRRQCPRAAPLTVPQLMALIRSVPRLLLLNGAEATVSLAAIVSLQQHQSQLRLDMLGTRGGQAGYSAAGQMNTIGGASGYVDPGRAQRFVSVVATTVPSSFFVPLRYLTACRFVRKFLGADCSPDALLEALQRLPRGVVDIRHLESGLTTGQRVWVRCLNTKDAAPRQLLHDRPEDAAGEYCVAALARRLAVELDDFAANGQMHRLRLAKGFGVAELSRIISKELMRDVRAIFYDNECPHSDVSPARGDGEGEGGEAAAAGCEALLLVCDRARHLMDVNLQCGTVRTWAHLPESEQPSSLMWETTPLPRVLRCILHALEHRPLSPGDLCDRLSAQDRNSLLSLYSDTAAPLDDKHAGKVGSSDSHVQDEPSQAVGAQAIIAFVRQHSLFVTMKGGLVYTPHLVVDETLPLGGPGAPRGKAGAARLAQRRARSFSAAEKASMVYEAMPPGQPLYLGSLLNLPAVRALPFGSNELTPRFFEQNRSFFRLHTPFAGAGSTVVSRVEDPPPPADILEPTSLDDIDRLIKYIALLCIGGAVDSSIMNTLSKDARLIVKQFGGVAGLAEQLPFWFTVRRSKDFSGSLITYTATSAPLSSQDEDNEGDGGRGSDAEVAGSDINEDEEWERQLRRDGYDV